MCLSRYKVTAGVAVSNRAREFYEGKLGLLVGVDSCDDLQYQCAERLQASAYCATSRKVFFSPMPPTMMGGRGRLTAGGLFIASCAWGESRGGGVGEPITCLIDGARRAL